MRFVIKSRDRLGITQEILSVFSKQKWNLLSMEMFLHHTYVQLDLKDGIKLSDVRQELVHVEGVTEVVEVDLMPGERRSQHLDAVLSKLQDPILDIDDKGKILLANTAANVMLKKEDQNNIQGCYLTEFTDQTMDTFLPEAPLSVCVTLTGQSFLADITPVFSYNKEDKQISGAVLLLQSVRRIGQQISAITQVPADNSSSLIGNSEATQELLKYSERFSHLDLPVLIQGETGTGKELLAHILHDSGSRAQAPFMAINCAALPENLLESELFGYAPGAFSGARKNGKPGLFELADGGSVFLDEIGEMSPYLQAKLLRFLQEYSFRRIGGSKEVTVDVRIISATHRDLLSMAHNHEFREDLFYRLNVLNLKVPPLRERQSDIPALIKHFLIRASEQTGREIPQVSEEAMNSLIQYPWPGNIRELQNTLFRAVAMSDNDLLDTNHIALDTPDDGEKNTISYSNVDSLDSALGHFEQELLQSLYPHYPSSRKLGQRLKVSHNTVALKLKKYGITK